MRSHLQKCMERDNETGVVTPSHNVVYVCSCWYGCMSRVCVFVLVWLYVSCMCVRVGMAVCLVYVCSCWYGCISRVCVFVLVWLCVSCMCVRVGMAVCPVYVCSCWYGCAFYHAEYYTCTVNHVTIRHMCGLQIVLSANHIAFNSVMCVL